ncbi:SAM-dependent methyltransferase [Pseudofrankia asymbiotica]
MQNPEAGAYDPTCNGPLVLVHARALLASSPEGRTAYLNADVRDVNV